MQVLSVRPDGELIGAVGIVLEAVVQIVVQNGGAGAKGDLPSVIGEQIHAVMVVMLDDVQIAVQHHPVDQVGELAHAAAHAAAGLAAGDHQAVPESTPG